MSDNGADSTWAFWTGSLGGFVVGMAFTYPYKCSGSYLALKCTTVIGAPANTLDKNGATILSFGIGVIMYFIVKSIVDARGGA